MDKWQWVSVGIAVLLGVGYICLAYYLLMLELK